jgi:hypothetical protein
VGRWKKWVCHCGFQSPLMSKSCVRCRLPRQFPSTPVSRAILAAWDVTTMCNWLCGSCFHVNLASFRVSTKPFSDRDDLLHLPHRIIEGTNTCRSCGHAWHAQMVSGGEQWRCACWFVNDKTHSQCPQCGRPNMKLSAGTLSWWTNGDWVCPTCRSHVYRARPHCGCGAPRPSRADPGNIVQERKSPTL